MPMWKCVPDFPDTFSWHSEVERLFNAPTREEEKSTISVIYIGFIRLSIGPQKVSVVCLLCYLDILQTKNIEAIFQL